ncbi:hypothetical protein EAE96_001415 [Botrytis aclada]|nr:hypothetical protein EAE96_001415 [Botrytis aclada]
MVVPWTTQSDELLIWVAGGVWRHEKRMRGEEFMISQTHLFDRVGDFLDALNKFQPFDKGRDDFKEQSIQGHIRCRKMQWKEPRCVERPPWLSGDILNGQFGEVGLRALHESTSRLRRATEINAADGRKRIQDRERFVQNQERYAAKERRPLQQKEEADQRWEDAQRGKKLSEGGKKLQGKDFGQRKKKRFGSTN